ncbi:hypothetical protein AYJ54_32985 [Bradyrhizobium centrolobii]|uniref:Cytochrome c domain-containing protein n=1 Tax=Bradyrhizobium centrolobii TaxID=1505087 RepID=A0A176Y9X3_9BRAD|nr:c-type cytochrome [Bradyrhizobium centrolobii]OAE99695.1 hypothetical protein AYJ54_32985 [Bradyrhizobium centrolobii]
MNYDPPTPVERVLTRYRWIRFLVLLLLLLLAVYYLVFVNQYVVAYKDSGEHFKYGSIGSEPNNGIPTLVFKALAVMYRDELGPTGYRRFGLLYETEQSELPVGMSRRIVTGVERVWLNCAVCHVGTFRINPSDKPILIYGAPSNNLRLYDLLKFFLKVGADPKFNADNLIAAINSPEVGGRLSFIDRAIYRYIVFPRVQAAFLHLSQQFAFLGRQGDGGGNGRPSYHPYYDWGPGRVDTFNPYKAIQFNFPMDAAHISLTELNGSSDFPSIWAQRPRDGMHLHWDGNNTSVDERNLSAALGAGVTPVSVDIAAIRRVRAWIWEMPPPPFPDPRSIDQSKVDRGRELFASYCAACHGMSRSGKYSYDTNLFPRLGQIESLKQIGTDSGRWQSYTQDFAATQNTLYAGYPWRFSHFTKTAGYANQPLDGIWARSPYLHNGSVPTLRDLLEPARSRPAQWYRGSDVLDVKKVGYRSDASAAAPEDLFLYDTGIPGNSNSGHEGRAYGTELPAADKDALVEYMKTL